MNRLAHPFSGVAAIYFPIGTLDEGGTCEFASKKCLDVCGAFKNATTTNKIGYEAKCGAFSDITQCKTHDVIREIAKEVKELNSDILYWFASGDCPSEFTKRITHIIEGLSYIIPVQMGFTRNEKLWQNTNQIDNVRIVLTLEKPYKSKLQHMSSLGTIAIPNYTTGLIKLYNCNRSYSSCGADIVYVKKLGETIKKKADCSNCFKEHIGCFRDFEIKENYDEEI